MLLTFNQNFRLHKNTLDLIHVACSCGDLSSHLSACPVPFMVLKKLITVSPPSWNMKRAYFYIQYWLLPLVDSLEDKWMYTRRHLITGYTVDVNLGKWSTVHFVAVGRTIGIQECIFFCFVCYLFVVFRNIISKWQLLNEDFFNFLYRLAHTYWCLSFSSSIRICRSFTFFFFF